MHKMDLSGPGSPLEQDFQVIRAEARNQLLLYMQKFPEKRGKLT